MTSTSKTVSIDKLDEIVYKYNSSYHTTKMKLVDVMSRTCIDVDKENNEKDPKFNEGDYVIPNWPENALIIKKVKNTVPWRYVIN